MIVHNTTRNHASCIELPPQLIRALQSYDYVSSLVRKYCAQVQRTRTSDAAISTAGGGRPHKSPSTICLRQYAHQKSCKIPQTSYRTARTLLRHTKTYFSAENHNYNCKQAVLPCSKQSLPNGTLLISLACQTTLRTCPLSHTLQESRLLHLCLLTFLALSKSHPYVDVASKQLEWGHQPKLAIFDQSLSPSTHGRTIFDQIPHSYT